ncbi:MAG: ATP-dependent zinc metalloprotease FtsH [Bacteroidia bacterium]|nr:ATP-dependent zinc metalloprotease FtsH [Bacteroidia bacterium]
MTENANKDDTSKQEITKSKFPNISSNWFYLVILIGLGIYFFSKPIYQTQETSWVNFKNDMLFTRDVEKIRIVNQELVEVFIKKESLSKEKFKSVLPSQEILILAKPHFYFTIGSIDFFEQQLKDAQANFSDKEKINEVYVKRDSWWSNLLTWIFPISLLIIFFSFWKRMNSVGKGIGGSIFDFTKSKPAKYEIGKLSSITFKDIAGYDEAKIEVMEIVEFLKFPEHFTRLGAKIPKGVLLLGPPGTGKTYMAKAVAGEAGVPFFSLSGSEFVEMFVGVGAARVRDLFDKAKQSAPSIVFIDEIDSIGRIRGAAVSVQTNDERESTLNQLLAEMDGFDVNTNVMVIAATNRPDILDSALLRPGRFDRHIFLELPNKREREAIYKVHMKPLILDKAIDLDYIVSQTPGFSGADIANSCNEAALIAARSKKNSVDVDDFIEAIDRIVRGLEKKSKLISPDEKKVIAYHEAGHALVSWMLKNTEQLVKVSIIPRGQSLGAAQYLPEERQIYTYSQLIDNLCVDLGGRTAEEIIFNEASSGALDDLEKVTKQAYVMVANFGLSKIIGNVSFYDSEGLSQDFQKPYSEATAELIDLEVRRLTNEAHERAKLIINDHLDKLKKLAEYLLQNEVINIEELELILGKRNFEVVTKKNNLQSLTA